MAKFMKIDGAVVSAKSMGKLIGLSDRRVRQLAEEGIIPKTEGGSYELVKAISSYINFLKLNNEIDNTNLAEAYEKEKVLHERAKRQKAEILVRKIKNEVHESEDVEIVLTEMLANFKAKLLSIPTKIAPEIVGYSETSLVEDILKREMYETLEELSEYNPEDFKSDKYIEIEEVEGGDIVGEKDS